MSTAPFDSVPVAALGNSADSPPIGELHWNKTFRIIPSRYPPVALFESLVDAEDIDDVLALESMTNPRLALDLGGVAKVAKKDRIVGPGSTPVMAAFIYKSWPSRFTQGNYGVYYCAHTEATALRETIYHKERFLLATAEPPTTIEMRVYVGRFGGRLHDIRKGFEAEHSKDSYESSQALGARLHKGGSTGICYRSVRHKGGECLALFTPKSVGLVKQGAHFWYRFDGERIDAYLRTGDEHWSQL